MPFAPRSSSRPPYLEVAYVVVVIIATLQILIKEGQGLIFYFDEWDFLLHRDLSVNGLLNPHNGHLSTLPVLSYVVLRSLFGTSSYLPYQLLGFLVHLAVALAGYRILRPHSRFVALLILPLLCLLGAGWQNIMWPFQIGMMGALLFGLFAFKEISRETPRNRLVLWVTGSLLCAGGGIAVLAASFLTLVLRKAWVHVAMIAGVGAAFLLWQSVFGSSQAQSANLAYLPSYVWNSFIASSNGMLGRSNGSIHTIVLVLLVVTPFLALFLKSTGSRWEVVSLGLFLILTWSLTALSRGQLGDPGASRYVYVSAVCLVLLLSLCISRLSPLVTGLPLVFVLLFTIQPGIELLRAGSGGLRDTSFHVRSAMTAIDLTDQIPQVDFSVDGVRSPQLTVRAYDYLAKQSGVIGFRSVELSKLPEEYRQTADAMFVALGTSPVVPVVNLECDADQRRHNSQFELLSGEKIFVKSTTTRNLTLRRFGQSESSIAQFEMKADAWYRVSNLASREVPALFVDGAGIDLESCAID